MQGKKFIPNSCKGDSGGPLFIRELAGQPWTQIGIVSYGLEYGCGTNKPNIYTKVEGYLQWIENKLEP